MPHAACPSIACRAHPDREAIPLSKRDLLLSLAAAVGAAALSASRAAAAANIDAEVAPSSEAPQPQQSQQPISYKSLTDDTLAYTFDYPVSTSSGRSIPLVLARKPERYSSAAPLTADARQRIVCQLAYLSDAVTVNVSVGPPGPVLKAKDPTTWTAKLVAEQVLVDKSTARVTSGQRVSLSSVEEAAVEDREGIKYYVYEYVAQASETFSFFPSAFGYLRLCTCPPQSPFPPFLFFL
jgi:hypothetical protein